MSHLLLYVVGKSEETKETVKPIISHKSFLPSCSALKRIQHVFSLSFTLQSLINLWLASRVSQVTSWKFYFNSSFTGTLFLVGKKGKGFPLAYLFIYSHSSITFFYNYLGSILSFINNYKNNGGYQIFFKFCYNMFIF